MSAVDETGYIENWSKLEEKMKKGLSSKKEQIRYEKLKKAEE